MTKILVVEDEFPIADLINIALTNEIGRASCRERV